MSATSVVLDCAALSDLADAETKRPRSKTRAILRVAWERGTRCWFRLLFAQRLVVVKPERERWRLCLPVTRLIKTAATERVIDMSTSCGRKFAGFLKSLLSVLLHCALVKRPGCLEPFLATENHNLPAISR
jgi:hypothetical protein